MKTTADWFTVEESFRQAAQQRSGPPAEKSAAELRQNGLGFCGALQDRKAFVRRLEAVQGNKLSRRSSIDSTTILRGDSKVLMIFVHGASGLANTDEFSLSDAFAMVVLTDAEHKNGVCHRCTRTIDDSLAPQWREYFFLECSPQAGSDDWGTLLDSGFSLDCRMYDFDDGQEDQLLGSVHLPLSEIPLLRTGELSDNDWINQYARG